MEHYSSGSPWEPLVGYSRAIKIGNMIHVSGTTALNESGEIVGLNSAAQQMNQCILNIEKALNHFGAELKNVYRTRIYVVDISKWEEVGKVHGKYFQEIMPSSTMVEVSALISKEILVEIEAEAYLE